MTTPSSAFGFPLEISMPRMDTEQQHMESMMRSGSLFQVHEEPLDRPENIADLASKLDDDMIDI